MVVIVAQLVPPYATDHSRRISIFVVVPLGFLFIPPALLMSTALFLFTTHTSMNCLGFLTAQYGANSINNLRAHTDMISRCLI